MKSVQERNPALEGLQGTILVSEQDAVNRESIRTILVDAGSTVHATSDWGRWLSRLNEITPDLILLGLASTPLDGLLQLCREMKADRSARHIPVICLVESINEDTINEDTLQAVLNAGGCDYVRKPVRRAELLIRVNAVLDRSRTIRLSKRVEELQTVLKTVGGVCHELNQPLQYVLGVVQVMMMDVSPNDDIYVHMDEIRARAEDMGEITRRLFDITGPRP